MNEVKVGDKMKCVKTVFSFDDPELVLCKEGEIVTVIEVDEDYGAMVETENLAHSFFAEEGEFETIVVGDYLKCILEGSPDSLFTIGEIVRVIRIENDCKVIVENQDGSIEADIAAGEFEFFAE